MGVRLTWVGVLTGFMRPVILLLLVLLMPISTAFLTDNIGPGETIGEGGEIEIILKDGYWSQDNWNALQNNGVTPLRIISPSTLLAWTNAEDINLDLPVEINDAQQAPYKAGLDGLLPSSETMLRLVFEPRLPEVAALQLSQQLALFSIAIGDQKLLLSSPIPQVIVVKWKYDDAQLFSQLLEVDGLLWVEPVLETVARNTQSASIHQNGELSGNPAWDLGLNASGVVVG
jgi:hypothetical protein